MRLRGLLQRVLVDVRMCPFSDLAGGWLAASRLAFVRGVRFLQVLGLVGYIFFTPKCILLVSGNPGSANRMMVVYS